MTSSSRSLTSNDSEASQKSDRSQDSDASSEARHSHKGRTFIHFTKYLWNSFSVFQTLKWVLIATAIIGVCLGITTGVVSTLSYANIVVLGITNVGMLAGTNALLVAILGFGASTSIATLSIVVTINTLSKSFKQNKESSRPDSATD